jgi:rhodanese-related sulfurtransferase
VDVLAVGSETIPSSHGLAFGGLYLQEAAAEAEYSARVLSLLGLLAPDKARAIVFFCEGRESWRAANAAQRARDAGYTQVQWYRGGLTSWKAANLATAPLRVRAVAN